MQNKKISLYNDDDDEYDMRLKYLGLFIVTIILMGGTIFYDGKYNIKSKYLTILLCLFIFVPITGICVYSIEYDDNKKDYNRKHVNTLLYTSIAFIVLSVLSIIYFIYTFINKKYNDENN